MVVAQEARAARIGLAVLERGGNAVDAAVATGFAMAVTYPRAGNIGGGGYMVIHLAERQRGPKAGPRNIAIDYRETAPAAATRDMFLDEKGNADPTQVARLRAGDRRARHRRRAGAGASALRLRPPDAGGADRAGDRARARRLRGRGRHRGLAAARAHAARRAGRHRRRSSCKPDGNALAPGDTAGAARPRRHARSDRASTGRARSTKARSPRSSPPRCRPPAAS